MFILYKDYNYKFVKIVDIVDSVKNVEFDWIEAENDVCTRLLSNFPINEVLMRKEILKFNIISLEKLNLGYFEHNSIPKENREFYLANFKSDVYNQVKNEASKAIAGPVLITTSDGYTGLYSYTLEDQLNLINLLSSVKSNKKVYYGAVGEELRLYSKTDLKLIHTTLENQKRKVIAYLNALKKYLNTLTISNYLENDVIYFGFMNDYIKKEMEEVYERNKI